MATIKIGPHGHRYVTIDFTRLDTLVKAGVDPSKPWARWTLSGGKEKYSTPEQLYEAVIGYFEWASDYGLKEQVVFHHQGDITKDWKNKKRIMTIRGLCNHLSITTQTWGLWRKDRQDLIPIIEMAEQIMRSDIDEVAAAGLVSGSYVAKLVGLKDSIDVTSSDGSMTPQVWSPDEVVKELKRRGLPADILES